MAVTKSAPTQIGSITGLAAGSSYTTSLFDVTDAVAAEIEVVMSFASAPTSGAVEVAIYPSQDGTNAASEAIIIAAAYPTTTSHRYILPVSVLADPYIQVKITNNTDQSGDFTINAIKTTA